MSQKYDVIVVGGGHNGLISAGLLARHGLRVLLLEKRASVGGAATTEFPWGPKYQVSSLAYVISLMPPEVVNDLELARFGYKVFPQHGYFAPYSDGRYLQLTGELSRQREQVARFSVKDSQALEGWDRWLGGLARQLSPLLMTVPPRLGSKRPGDLLDMLRLAWKLRGLSVEQVGDLTRLFTLSVADLLEQHFSSPQLLGLLSVSGIIGTWAGPRSPGTAYVMAHHKMGEGAAWGFPQGGMGGAAAAMRRAAQAFGATLLTECGVKRVTTRDGRVTGVVTESGREYEAGLVITTLPPRRAFLEQLDSGLLPDAFVAAVEAWRSRSGTVKINLALDRLPEFACKPGFDAEVHGGTIVLAESLDDLEGAFQDAVAGQPARRPFADLCIPSVFDPTLAPPGHYVASIFSQWVPHHFVEQPHQAELEQYADRLIGRLEQLAPGFTSSILHRQVIGPYQMAHEYGLVGGNIFHGELSLGQLFHMRPAAGWCNFRTPVRGLYYASSATHGGGGVTGIPALQAVRAVVADLRNGSLRK